MSRAVPLGLVIGLRHAVDPDPVVGVSAIAAREGHPWRATWVGVSWGPGHRATLLCLGLAVLAASALPTPAPALLYLFAFGCGTIAGMVNCSTLVGAPFARLGGAPRLRQAMTGPTGAASLALGAYGLLDCSRQAPSAGVL